MAMVCHTGTPARMLYERLMADRYTGWRELFGDQLPAVAQHLMDECEDAGILLREPSDRSDDDFEYGIELIFDCAILDDFSPIEERREMLEVIEEKCREARVALRMPATRLKLHG